MTVHEALLTLELIHSFPPLTVTAVNHASLTKQALRTPRKVLQGQGMENSKAPRQEFVKHVPKHKEATNIQEWQSKNELCESSRPGVFSSLLDNSGLPVGVVLWAIITVCVCVCT